MLPLIHLNLEIWEGISSDQIDYIYESDRNDIPTIYSGYFTNQQYSRCHQYLDIKVLSCKETSFNTLYKLFNDIKSCFETYNPYNTIIYDQIFEEFIFNNDSNYRSLSDIDSKVEDYYLYDDITNHPNWSWDKYNLINILD